MDKDKTNAHKLRKSYMPKNDNLAERILNSCKQLKIRKRSRLLYETRHLEKRLEKPIPYNLSIKLYVHTLSSQPPIFTNNQ